MVTSLRSGKARANAERDSDVKYREKGKNKARSRVVSKRPQSRTLDPMEVQSKEQPKMELFLSHRKVELC